MPPAFPSASSLSKAKASPKPNSATPANTPSATKSPPSLPASLTLADARELALKNHPRLTAADLKTLAAQQLLAQARAPRLPIFTANFTAVGTPERDTRIGAGALNNPSIFERAGAGLVVSQLLTDFGRTADLIETSRLRARAEGELAQTVRSLLLLQVTASYFNALQAQSVLAVARQTLTNRQVLLDQVSALARLNSKGGVTVDEAGKDSGSSKVVLPNSPPI